MSKDVEDPIKCTMVTKYFEFIEESGANLKKSKASRDSAPSTPMIKRKQVSNKKIDIKSSDYFEELADKEKGSIEKDFEKIVKIVLDPKSHFIVDQISKHKYGDVSIEEKLLLLAATTSGKSKYYDHGVLQYQKFAELETGDCFNEVSLVMSVPAEYTIIASEDLHILQFSKEDFKSIFSKRIKNLADRTAYLNQMFPDFSNELLSKISYFLKEKSFDNYQILYQEGDEPEEIYFVRQGQIQLLSHRNYDKRKNVPNSELLKIEKKATFATKQQILVGNIQPFGICGEEEIVHHEKRKFEARSGSIKTTVYYLKAKVFLLFFIEKFSIIQTSFQNTYIWSQNR